MPSLGEYRVGLDFNPSGNPQVHEIKKMAADLIDYCNGLASGSNSEAGRCFGLATDMIETAAMWAVKGATKKARE